MQDTPGAPIRYSDTEGLNRLWLVIRPIIDILDTVAIFEDDRQPPITEWFERTTAGLPPAMTSEMQSWFEIMHHGTESSPRRRPRSTKTIQIYTTVALPAIRQWANEGTASLHEIIRPQVVAALPTDPGRRKSLGQAMGSIFGILKDHQVIFANPAVRLAHHTNTPINAPGVDLDIVHEALQSPDPTRAAVCALVAFHGLRSHHLRKLHLTDIQDRNLQLGDRANPLADPVRRRITAWLDYRNQRWPNSTNPHLFIHFRTAGDPRRLSDMFGLSIQHASRYTDIINEPAVPTHQPGASNQPE